MIVQKEGVLECPLKEETDVLYRELMENVNEKVDTAPSPSTHVSEDLIFSILRSIHSAGFILY